jgi:hypothetical protein
MILTKQLQVVIDSSLAQGRDYEDIREILMKQGFQDADISELFAQHRGGAQTVQQPKITDTDLGLIKTQTSTPPVATVQTPKEQLFNKNFVHPEIKPGFVPVGFEKEDTPQSEVKSEIDTFMNVGTNTQTAAHAMNQEQNKNLPAPGTVPLPSELNQVAPKIINEQGLSNGENPMSTAPVSVPSIDSSKKYINVGFGGMPEIEKVLAEEQAKKIEKSPWPLVFVLLILIALMGGFFYWFLVLNKDTGEMTESEKLLQELESEKTAEQTPIAPPAPTGPVDPFTGLPIEGN